MKTVKSEEILMNFPVTKSSVVFPRKRSLYFQLEPYLQNVRGNSGVLFQEMDFEDEKLQYFDSEDEKLQYFDFETGYWRSPLSHTINFETENSHHKCLKSGVIEMSLSKPIKNYQKAGSEGQRGKKETFSQSYNVPSTSSRTCSEKFGESRSRIDNKSKDSFF